MTLNTDTPFLYRFVLYCKFFDDVTNVTVLYGTELKRRTFVPGRNKSRVKGRSRVDASDSDWMRARLNVQTGTHVHATTPINILRGLFLYSTVDTNCHKDPVRISCIIVPRQRLLDSLRTDTRHGVRVVVEKERIPYRTSYFAVLVIVVCLE